MRDVGKTLEKLFRKRRAYGARTYGVDSHALRPQVDGQTFRYLPQRPLGQTVAEAVGLAHIALIGSVDDHAPPALQQAGHGGTQGVHRPFDVGVYHKVKLFLADIQHGVAAMNASIGHHGIQPSESPARSGDGPVQIFTGARASLDEQRPRFLRKLHSIFFIDIHKRHVPPFPGELADARGAYARGTARDEYRFFHLAHDDSPLILCKPDSSVTAERFDAAVVGGFRLPGKKAAWNAFVMVAMMRDAFTAFAVSQTIVGAGAGSLIVATHIYSLAACIHRKKTTSFHPIT